MSNHTAPNERQKRVEDHKLQKKVGDLVRALDVQIGLDALIEGEHQLEVVLNGRGAVGQVQITSQATCRPSRTRTGGPCRTSTSDSRALHVSGRMSPAWRILCRCSSPGASTPGPWFCLKVIVGFQGGGHLSSGAPYKVSTDPER